MLTKNTIKNVQLLHHKKNRSIQQQFLVEGAKNVLELLTSNYIVEQLYVSAQFYDENTKVLQNCQIAPIITDIISLGKMSTLSTNNAAIAVVKTKNNTEVFSEADWVLCLDGINDPGNLGTIIRIADWYGINKIVASHSTVEQYNPKVIAATMGSFTRVCVYYCDLDSYLSKLHHTAIFGAVMNGQSVYKQAFGPAGYLVIGNESHGISAPIQALLKHQITIPKRGTAESLNAGIATAVILDNVFRGA
jgi:RNA methyltransferase, TrmH family